MEATNGRVILEYVTKQGFTDAVKAIRDHTRAERDAAVGESRAAMVKELELLEARITKSVSELKSQMMEEFSRRLADAGQAHASQLDTVKELFRSGQPNIVVNVPEQAAPVVNVTTPKLDQPIINVAAPAARIENVVNVPELKQPTVHVAAPVVNVAAADVLLPELSPVFNVNVPEQPAPVVNFPNLNLKPSFNVKVPEQAPPTVTVNVPEQPASIVNVTVPKRKITKTIQYDQANRPSSITEEEG